MISAAQYAQAMQAASSAKKAGFELEVSGSRFVLKPANGFASVLLKDETLVHYDNLENAAAFLRGWEIFSKHLTSVAGIDLTEVKSRIEQQRVADTLAGKKRRAIRF
jgi:hypothetical protein